MSRYNPHPHRAAGRPWPLLALAPLLLLTIVPAGCIHNDLPYPRIPQAIRQLACEGELSPAAIDSANSTATLFLEETTDIQNVRFTEFTFTPGATADPNLLEGSYDLSSPIVVSLSLYQTYQWIVKAEQNIERYFTVDGQIGTTAIDAIGHRVIVKVPDTMDLSDLTLTSAKLGPAGITTMVPDLRPGRLDLARPLAVEVTFHGRTEHWTIFAEKTAQLVSTASADAWSQVAWLYGNGPADVRNTFEWREGTEGEWTRVDIDEVEQESGSFSCRVAHLKPLTTYQVRAVSGEETGNILTVTTQPTEVLPDGSFELWHKVGAVWYPFPEGGPEFWDTGNKGAATLGQSNVTPTEEVPPGQTGKAARLETRFVGFGPVGKLAAGSIYTGSFVRVDGTNGILDFGRPWHLRPTRLRGYYSYKTAPIDYASTDFKSLMGQPDACHIYIALTDWTAPFQIRTKPSDRQLFDSQSPEVIAYGELIRDTDTDGYEEFTIELNYRSTSRVPTYIQITAAASKLGDYFTGGTGATLLVDDFSLEYDY